MIPVNDGGRPRAPDLRQRHPLRAAHRFSMEGVGRDRNLLSLRGPSALSGMGRQGVAGTLAGGAGTL